MSDSEPAFDDSMTLEPPGSIAVVGAGPLGIEAALYGRVLGYNVTLIEADAVAASLRARLEDPLPMLPDRCLTPIALAALRAQNSGNGDEDDGDPLLPTTIRQWVEEAWVPLVETDLLSGRLRISRVTQIETIDVDADLDQDDGEVGDLPPDFRLTLRTDTTPPEHLDVEAVILAVGVNHEIQVGFELPAPYFFRVGATTVGLPEKDLLRGLREIVAVFAQLGGRADLDLYRPRRI